MRLDMPCAGAWVIDRRDGSADDLVNAGCVSRPRNRSRGGCASAPPLSVCPVGWGSIVTASLHLFSPSASHDLAVRLEPPERLMVGSRPGVARVMPRQDRRKEHKWP